MNTSAALSDNSSSDRRLLPRSQVGRPCFDINGRVAGIQIDMTSPVDPELAQFRFRVGQQVQWDGEIWAVLGRQLTEAGRRIYIVYRDDDRRPTRTVLERVLAPR
jgi:hypothetical protein